MPNRRTEHSHFSSFDGLSLYAETDAVEAPRAAVLLSHGFAEHCGRYAEMVAGLNEQGLSCYRFDYRGHGRADGRRGHIFSFDDYLGDIRAFRDRVVQATPGLPRIMLAHSNGGLIALHSLADDPDGIDALVLSSPFFGFKIQVPAVKAGMGRLMSRLVPAFSMPTAIDPATVSHDPNVVAQYASDPLNGTAASSRWFTETVAAQASLRQKAGKVTLPVLMQLAGDDRIACVDSARQIFDRLSSEDRTWQVYEGLFHEIWFELERNRPISALYTWLNAQLEKV